MLEMKHPDLVFLWLKYKEAHPDGYQLSQFYKLYRDFLHEIFGLEKVSMPVERIPGEKMYIDWVADHPELLTDPSTGEIPKHMNDSDRSFLDDLLPWSETLPDAVRKPKKQWSRAAGADSGL